MVLLPLPREEHARLGHAHSMLSNDRRRIELSPHLAPAPAYFASSHTAEPGTRSDTYIRRPSESLGEARTSCLLGATSASSRVPSPSERLFVGTCI